MARLPQPGGDNGTWGNLLNDFLSQAHDSSGALIPSAVSAAMPDASDSNKGKVQLGGDLSGTASSPTVSAINGVNLSGIPTAGQTLVASGSSAASWQTPPSGVTDPPMGGDLTGTASSAQIASGVIVDADVNASAAIAQSKIAGLTTDLASKATDTAVIHNTIVDAKGDILTATADNTPARIATGTDGQFLRADSATSTGLIWDSVTAGEVGAIPTSEKGQPNGVAGLDGSGKVTPGQLQTTNITKVLPYSNTATLTVSPGAHRLYNDSGTTWTIQRVRASVGTAPAGASIIVDVNINGTTIFTAQANRPTIAAAANTSGAVTNMDITTITNGQYMTVDVDQVGSTTAGANLTVQVEVI